MASPDQIARLAEGVESSNTWRKQHPEIIPDLAGADLRGANLSAANLFEADLGGANLGGADLRGANLNGLANLRGANLSGADLRNAQLDSAILCEADLRNADLREASLFGADLQEAKLCYANLRFTSLIDADLRNADLTGALVFGTSVWKLKLEGATQRDLIITEYNQPPVTVDNIEVAQFIHLLLHNEKIRHVIDTVTSKAVLILGRFTAERKAVLDAVREELRKRNYLPIMFDFSVPATRDTSETITLLARLSRFIIADLTDPSSIPQELEAIIPDLAVPVQPLIKGAAPPHAMFKAYWKFQWVLPLYRYEGIAPLLAALADKVIAPAEAKVKDLAERRRVFEAQLNESQ
jgi:hypothetical protein